MVIFEVVKEFAGSLVLALILGAKTFSCKRKIGLVVSRLKKKGKR